MDFGPINGTLFDCNCSKCYFFHEKIYIKDLADAYIMCFYFQFIMDGVFVYGRGYYFKWLVAIIIYIILKKNKIIWLDLLHFIFLNITLFPENNEW